MIMGGQIFQVAIGIVAKQQCLLRDKAAISHLYHPIELFQLVGGGITEIGPSVVNAILIRDVDRHNVVIEIAVLKDILVRQDIHFHLEEPFIGVDKVVDAQTRREAGVGNIARIIVFKMIEGGG